MSYVYTIIYITVYEEVVKILKRLKNLFTILQKIIEFQSITHKRRE